MDSVGADISAGKDKVAVQIILFPAKLVAGISVGSVESRSGISINVRSVLGKITSQVHFNKCGGGHIIIGEADALNAELWGKDPQQAVKLSRFAAAVQPVDNDKPAVCVVIHYKSILY